MVAGDIRKNYGAAADQVSDEIIERVGLADSPTTASTSSRPVRRGWSSSGARSRRGRGCCCSTSRHRVSTSRRPMQLGALAARARARGHRGAARRARRAARHGGVRPHPRARLRAHHRGTGTRDEIQHRRGGARGVPRQQPGRCDVTAVPPATDVEHRCSSCAASAPRTAASTCCTASTSSCRAGTVRRAARPERRGQVHHAARSRAGLHAADRRRRVRRGPARQRRAARTSSPARGLCLVPEGRGIFPNLTCARTSGW